MFKRRVQQTDSAQTPRKYSDAIKHLIGTKVDTKIKVNPTGSGKYGSRYFTASFEIPGSNMTYTAEYNVSGTTVEHDAFLVDDQIQVEINFDNDFLNQEVPETGIDWNAVCRNLQIEFSANKKTASTLFV